MEARKVEMLDASGTPTARLWVVVDGGEEDIHVISVYLRIGTCC
jgi:hypothetical protein